MMPDATHAGHAPESMFWSKSRLDCTLFVALILSATSSGCCQLETMATSVSHWGENRCNCGECSTCTPGCGPACVSLQPPTGYLNDGATFGGEQIIGDAGKTAVDRLVEVDQELQQAQVDNEQLRQELEYARQTIEEQGRAIDAASNELKRAMTDYREMRRRLESWYADLNSIDAEVERAFQQNDDLLEQFEQELEDVLIRCESPSDVGSSVSLSPPSNRSAGAVTRFVQ